MLEGLNAKFIIFVKAVLFTWMLHINQVFKLCLLMYNILMCNAFKLPQWWKIKILILFICLCGVFFICFKTNHEEINKSTPLLSFFSLKLQWNKDSHKNAVWNRWCFWHHKLLACIQSNQGVIVNEWLSWF